MAEITQPRVARFHATVTDQIAPVVRQLHYSQTHLPEHGNAISVLAQRFGALEGEDYAYPMFTARAFQVRRRLHGQEDIGMRGDARLPLRQCLFTALESSIVQPEKSLRPWTHNQSGKTRITNRLQLPQQ